MTSYAAALLLPAKSEPTGALNKLGGRPVAGPSPWPLHPDELDQPLHLVAQLDCQSLHQAVPGNPLPTKGVLQVFLDTTTFVDTELFPPSCVLWQSEVDPTQTLACPGDLPPVGGYAWDVISPQASSAQEAPRELPETMLQLVGLQTTRTQATRDSGRLRGLDPATHKPGYVTEWLLWHQALGLPPEATDQGPWVLAPKTRDHVLLLRLAADRDRGLCLSSSYSPSLSVWIDPDDLATRRFERAYAVLSDL